MTAARLALPDPGDLAAVANAADELLDEIADPAANEDPERLIDIWAVLDRWLYYQGRWVEQDSLRQRAQDAASRLSRTRELVLIHVSRAESYEAMGRLGDAREAAADAQRLARSVEDDAVRIRSMLKVAEVDAAKGTRTSRAVRRRLDSIVAAAQRAQLPALAAFAAYALANTFSRAPRRLVQLERVELLARTSLDPVEGQLALAFSKTALATERMRIKDWRGAELLALEGLRIKRELGARLPVANSLLQLAQLDEMRGDPSTAEARLTEVLDTYESLGSAPRVAAVAHRLGRMLEHAGRNAEAQSYYSRAAVALQTTQNTRALQVTLTDLGDVAVAMGDANRGLDYYRQALDAGENPMALWRRMVDLVVSGAKGQVAVAAMDRLLAGLRGGDNASLALAQALAAAAGLQGEEQRVPYLAEAMRALDDPATSPPFFRAQVEAALLLEFRRGADRLQASLTSYAAQHRRTIRNQPTASHAIVAAEIFFAAQDLATANRVARRALRIGKLSKSDMQTAMSLFGLIGREFEAVRAWPKALAAYQETSRLATELQDELVLGVVSADLGDVHRKSGRHDLAVAAYGRAIDFQYGRHDPQAEGSLHEHLGDSLGQIGRLNDARSEWEAAAAKFHELTAKRDEMRVRSKIEASNSSSR